MPDFKTPTFTPKKPQVPQAPEIPDGFDGVAVPSPNGEATYYSRKGLRVGSRVAYIDENGAQRAWVIQSLNEEKDADGQTYIKAEHVEEGAPSREVREGDISPSAPMPAVPGVGTLSQGSGPSPVERFQEMIRGAGKSVIDAVQGQVAVPAAIIEDRLFGRPGEAADALKAGDPSAGTAFGRELGAGVAPAGGGLAAAGAGAGVGAEIGGLFGPVGGAIGGVVGGVGGGMLGGAKVAQAQDALLKQLLSPRAAAELEASNAEIAEKQPAARDAGALAAQALFARPNLSLAAPAMGSRVIGGAIGGGIDAAQQKLTTGQVDLAQTGRQIAGGALLSGANTKAGDLLHGAGGAAGTSVAAPVVRFTRQAAAEAANPTGGITLNAGINPLLSRVSARRPSPPFVPLENVPASVRTDVVLPDYVLPADQAARPAADLSRELVTTRPGNLGALAERARVAVKPVSQTITAARQTAADGSLSPDHLFLMNLQAALQDDRGVNFAAWDRLRVGEDPITGLYTQGGVDFLTAPGIDGRLAGANRLGPGQEAIERSTTGAGSVSLDYFHPVDHPRLARRAKGEFNAIGVGTPEMLRGNVQAPALYLSALHAHALARGAADVKALEGALKAAVAAGLQESLGKATGQVIKTNAGFQNLPVEALRTNRAFQAAVEAHAASAGYSFDPSGKGELRTIMENLPFGSFEGRRSFVEALDKRLQASGHDFPSLAAHTEIMSAFPAQEFGRRSGNVIGGSWYDLNNPLGLPASALGAPTHTGYEIGYSGAPAGRLTAGRFLDFPKKGSSLPGAVPFWEVASQLRMGARDANGKLVLGKRLSELPAAKQNWNTVSKTGPWFVADADKPAVLAKLDEILKGIETDGNDSRSVSRSVTESGTDGGSAAGGAGQGISPAAGGGGAASLPGEGGLLPGVEGVPGQSAGTGSRAAGRQPVSDAPQPALGGGGSERGRVPGVEPPAQPHRMRLRIQEDHPVGAALYSGIDPRALSEGLRILGGGFKSAEADGPSVAENLSTWRKAGLLTNPATHARNILGNAGMQVSEEAARIPAAIADMARVAVARAAGGDQTALGRTLGTERTTLGTDLIAVGRASKEGVTRGGKEALEILRNGKVKNDRFDSGVELEKLGIDREYASKSPLANFYVNGIFRTLSAEDRIFRTYAFARSISEQADLVARLEAAALKKEGKPVTKRWEADRASELHAKPTDAMQAQAIVDAEVATFNNTNIANEAFTAFRQKAKASPLFSTALDTFFPFTRTPTNVLARILEYSIGTVYGPIKAGREVLKDLGNEKKLTAAQNELSAAKAAQVSDKGTGGFESATDRFNRVGTARAELEKAAAAVAGKAFTPAEQRAFAQTFGRGSIGLGLMVLGYKLADKGLMTGSNVSPSDYQKREKSKTSESAVYVGGMWHDVGFLAPVGTLLVLGATIREQQGRGVAMPLALAGGVAQQVGEAPMLSGTDQFKDLGDAKQFERMIGGMAGSYVPAAVAATAQAMDTRRRKLKPGGEKGGFIAGTIDSARQRLPGLREDVPVDKKAPRRPAISPFNPFRSKAGPKSKPGLFKKKEASPAVEKDELEMRIERRLSKFD